jgi:hypothetical protein
MVAPVPEQHVELEVEFPEHIRRWTVLIRFLLAIPHLVVLFLYSIVSWFVVVATWFAALVLGRVPAGLGDFLAGFLGWSTRFNGYLMLLSDRYPPFTNHDPYPVRVVLPPPGPLNRLAVLFRFILLIPGAILASLAVSGWWALFGLVTWVAELILGRVPVLLFTANSAVLRYNLRLTAYVMMLTPTYPKRLFGDGEPGPDPATPPTTRPLLLSTGGQVVVGVCIALGVLSYIQDGRQVAESGQQGGVSAQLGGP